MVNNSNMVWIDLEYTSLEIDRSQLMQIACVITDENLNVLDDGLEIAIHQIQEVLDQTDSDVIPTHQNSGLFQKVLDSKISVQEAEEKVIEYIKQFVDSGNSPLCGNSAHWDWRMIKKFMPNLGKYLFRRIVDVSTIKELYKRWRPNEPRFEKKHSHTALDDIKESIEELRYYRQIGFIG